MPVVVTIDGPAGAGKSTVARRLARELGFRYLDTGAMYRAVTLAALEGGIALEDGPLGELASRLSVEVLGDGRTLLDGRDVSEGIRSAEVTANVSAVSAQPAVRREMTRLQRAVGEAGDLVCEGRDMGTVVFPDAPVKVYLDAAPRCRAERRAKELAAAGRPIDVDDLTKEIETRDRLDSERSEAPLRRDGSQTFVDTSDMDIEQVVTRLREIVAARSGHTGDGT